MKVLSRKRRSFLKSCSRFQFHGCLCHPRREGALILRYELRSVAEWEGVAKMSHTFCYESEFIFLLDCALQKILQIGCPGCGTPVKMGRDRETK